MINRNTADASPSRSQSSAEIASLVKALEFYAEPRRYQGPNQHPLPNDPHAKPDQVYIQDVTRDGGSIARQALAKFSA